MKTRRAHFWQNLEGYCTFPDFYAWVPSQLPARPHCVEVGSYKGQSAALLAVELANARGGRLDLVDHWFGGPGVEFAGKVYASLAPVHDVMGMCYVGDSAETANKFADGSLDFVFIDANHEYEAVAKDIDAWRPKLTEHGILAGHDFTLDYPGVIKAVTERFERFEIWRGITNGGNAPMWGKFYPVWMVRGEALHRSVKRMLNDTIATEDGASTARAYDAVLEMIALNPTLDVLEETIMKLRTACR
jgi:hypothetical protein